MQNTIFKFSISAIPLVFLLACADNDKTTGFWQEMLSDSPINTYKQRTGKQIYEYRCQTCHARNTQGAPVPGDHYEWNKRRAKGMDVLLKHATEGYKRG
ncbi:MAG: c-type cytochrome, partial [Gammaproteobacteria bacterium]